MKKTMILLLLLITSAISKGQILHPVKWSYGAKKISSTEAVVFMKATIDDGWHVYSQFVADGGPVKTSFTFKPSGDYRLAGKTAEPKPVKRYEKVFSMNVGYFEHEVVFQQRIRLTHGGQTEVIGTLEYMTCNDHQCLPPEDVAFSIPVK